MSLMEREFVDRRTDELANCEKGHRGGQMEEEGGDADNSLKR